MAADTQSRPAGSSQGKPDDTSANLDSDPYICSLLEAVGHPFREERRRKPRGKTPLGRRAMLIVKGKRKPS